MKPTRRRMIPSSRRASVVDQFGQEPGVASSGFGGGTSPKALSEWRDPSGAAALNFPEPALATGPFRSATTDANENVLYHSLLEVASAKRFGPLFAQVDCRGEMRP